MKLFLCLIVLSAAVAANASAPEPKYTQLSCTGDDGSHLEIFGLGTDTLSLIDGFDPLNIQASSLGDCEGRKTFCYEAGQWMINIPKSLIRGNRKKGHLWVNSDTDDRPENNRLGDRYDCVATLYR